MTTRPRALDYTVLIGKWVDMERPSTPEERAAGYPDTNGMRCLVEEVRDIPLGVLIVTDEGLSAVVRSDDEHLWRFKIRSAPWRD